MSKFPVVAVLTDADSSAVGTVVYFSGLTDYWGCHGTVVAAPVDGLYPVGEFDEGWSNPYEDPSWTILEVDLEHWDDVVTIL